MLLERRELLNQYWYHLAPESVHTPMQWNYYYLIFHQIIMYSNKVKLVAVENNDPSHPSLHHPHPSYWMYKLTNK